jgi:hypothetical protein
MPVRAINSPSQLPRAVYVNTALVADLTSLNKCITSTKLLLADIAEGEVEVAKQDLIAVAADLARLCNRILGAAVQPLPVPSAATAAPEPTAPS